MMFSVRRVRTSAVTYNRVTSSFLFEFLQRELPGALGQHGDAQGDREAQQPAGVVHGNQTNKFLPLQSQNHHPNAAANPEVPETLGSAPEGFNKRLKLPLVPERCLAELWLGGRVVGVC